MADITDNKYVGVLLDFLDKHSLNPKNVAEGYKTLATSERPLETYTEGAKGYTGKLLAKVGEYMSDPMNFVGAMGITKKVSGNVLRNFDDVVHGKPVTLQVYHGTNAKAYIEKEGFKVPEGEKNPLAKEIQQKFKLRDDLDKQGFLGRGVYFTDSKSFSKKWGDEALNTEVTLNKPFVIDHAYIDDLRRLDINALKKEGYDGIIVKKGKYGLTGENYRQGIVFDPEKIKVAEFRTPNTISRGAIVINKETGEIGEIKNIRPLSDAAKEFHIEQGNNFNSFLEVKWKGSKKLGTKARIDGNVKDIDVEIY